MSIWPYMEIKIAVAVLAGLVAAKLAYQAVALIAPELSPFVFVFVLVIPGSYIAGLIVGWRRTNRPKNQIDRLP